MGSLIFQGGPHSKRALTKHCTHVPKPELESYTTSLAHFRARILGSAKPSNLGFKNNSARNAVTGDDSPQLQDVLDALNDPSCRAILHHTDEPKTAKQLTRLCDLSESTVYRKLDLLSSTSLLRETDTLLPGGGKKTQYQRDVDDFLISFEGDDAITVKVDRPPRSSDKRLADIWSKMGDEL